MMKKFDCVIIGIGRVGLPLGLSMASKGISVVGLDLRVNLLESLKNSMLYFNKLFKY